MYILRLVKNRNIDFEEHGNLEDREFYTLWRVQENYFEHLQFFEKMKQIKTFVPDKDKMAQEKEQYEKAMEILVFKEIKTPELL